MRAVLILILVRQCPNGIAQETERPTGMNCNLAAPPPTAAEEVNHGITLRISPLQAHRPQPTPAASRSC